MTSPKSLQNNFGYAYRTGLRDNALFAAINVVLMFFFFCLAPILVFREKTSMNEQTGRLTQVNFKEQYSFLFSADMTFYRYMVIAALLGIGLLMGIATFRFITGKKTVNVYYSLGIKRTRLFSAKYLSGLTLVGLSVALPMLVALIINLAVLGSNKYLFTAFFYLLIGMFSLVAFSYTLTAAVFATVGTAFEGVLFSGILLLFPQMLFSSLQVFIQRLVLGTPLGSEFSTSRYYTGEGSEVTLAKQFSACNPLRYMSDGLFTYAQGTAKGQLQDIDHGGEWISWQMPDFLVPIIWILATAALFAFGLFLYERRKAEIGGFIGKNKVLNFIGIFLVAIFGFAAAYDMLNSKGMAVALTVGIVVFVVIYAVLSLLLLRNFKQFLKDLPALGVQLALTALIFVFFSTGYFGAANKIPETAEIASAKISMPFTNYASAETGSDSYMMMAGINCIEPIPVGEYTSEKDIAFVRDIHEQLIEAGRTEPTVFDENFNGIYPIGVRIAYTLKNGKQVFRNYYGISDEILTALQQADKTDYQLSMLNKIFKDPVKAVERPKRNETTFNGGMMSNSEIWAYNEYRYLQAVRESEDIRLYNKTFTTETMLELTAEQRQTLRDCLYDDLSVQTAENHYNPESVLGVISFQFIQTEEDEEDTMFVPEGVTAAYGVEQAVADKVVGEDGEAIYAFTGKYFSQKCPDFCITPDMVKTVEFLKSVGCYDALHTDRTLKAVYGTKVTERFRYDYIADRIAYGMNFGCEFIGESSTVDTYAEYTGNWEGIRSEDKPTVYRTTDAEMMQSIYQNIVTRAKLAPNDYIVILEYSDGMRAKTYVHADKMPEAAKAEIEKNKPADSFYY